MSNMYNRMSGTPTAETQQNDQTNSTHVPLATPGVQPVANPAQVQQTVFIQTPGVSKLRVSTKLFVGLGVVQIVIGVLDIIMQIVATTANGFTGIIGTGFWCSLFFIMAGCFSIAAGKRKMFCLIVTCMVLSIISAVLTAFQFSLGVTAAILLDLYWIQSNFEYQRALVANITLSILALFEGVIAIITASFCCRAVCCGRTRSQAMVAYVPNQPGQVMGPMMIVQNPAMAGGSVPMGAGSGQPPLQEKAGELPPKTPPPEYYEENPNFHQ